MDDIGVGYIEIAITILVVKEAFSIVKMAIDKMKAGNGGGNPQPNLMGVECRSRFDRMEHKIDRIETSVVAPDRQPLHVTLRSVLGLVSKE